MIKLGRWLATLFVLSGYLATFPVSGFVFLWVFLLLGNQAKIEYLIIPV